MAGEPITTFPFLGTPEAGDKFYVVDVSDTTQSPEGSSKQTDLQEIANTLNSLLSYVPLGGTGEATGNPISGDVEVDVARGGKFTFNFPNGDQIIIGEDFGGYSAMKFVDGTTGGELWAYIRGADLYLNNPSSGDTVGGINTIINALQSSKLNFYNGFNTTTQGAFGTADILYLGFNGKQYLDNGVAGYKGYSQLKRYYFIDSCSYSQSGTNAPTIDSTFESQLQDYPMTGKVVSRQGVGHYRIEYIEQFGSNYLPTDFTRIKVITSQGAEPHVCISYSFPGFTSTTSLAIDIFTRQPSNNNLVDSHLDNSVIEVYFYL
jgi:hypothetical protein